MLLPIFAADVLHGGPVHARLPLGRVGRGRPGRGAVPGVAQTVLGLGRIIVLATALFGLGLIGFALSRWLWLSLLLMLLTGFGMMVQMAASNTILQTIVDEDKRGRVMSFYSMAFLGMAPFGSLFAGVLAGRIGAAGTVLVGGVACLVGAAAVRPAAARACGRWSARSTRGWASCRRSPPACSRRRN